MNSFLAIGRKTTPQSEDLPGGGPSDPWIPRQFVGDPDGDHLVRYFSPIVFF